MTNSTKVEKPWTKWHERLHKSLKSKSNLLPYGSSLLISVSGGQDSMALLKLILDLQRIYEWKVHVWHGDHGWHNQSRQIAEELEEWCKCQKLSFFCNRTNKQKVSTEEDARNWRYKSLIQQAKTLSKESPSLPCERVLTGHTANDRTETFIMNLARGAHLKGLSSLREDRTLETKIQLIRPILRFSRQETIQICDEMDLPIWIDPSNSNIAYSRNKIRAEIIPVLESLHPQSTIRISNLAERLTSLQKDQHQLAHLALGALLTSTGLSRSKMTKLSKTVRAIILAQWLEDNKAPLLSSKQLEELSQKIGKNKGPGNMDISNHLKIRWNKNSIELIN
ncbi:MULTISPECIES: tRNA lysidine(34) synthetase TilS [Prochlorococcus]|uniref:tRNA(Ile)-lysidine synthase n=1 Tax=Prochlorococcus marinus (strain SARG / CCMP1375 / SS120) TaxID=167539 RepID=TILS_PROMA|nr:MULTISPECIES: tRNA lysidine(34) synthetase TilS [Prochlorococcus]Q7V9L9.1 RecName: Full=tRNA(Ile)-lysidine synthase; AltName: Full=tRNA(Ile)-2-lysyl-cytidine synthase; AltName: Full=tRNA(Ile)-lysidine synthetase [Prochlorococcus marinus subsp. marinus str. CCMP1375]AAQ00855.1 Predicted ATPase of the PP-loop superfamily implicated in cell cycle control [Prochlorococcus marinus subsp. marinus str. CCMP1375]